MYLQNIDNGKDLMERIHIFFSKLQIEKDFIAEPLSMDEYSVSFTRNVWLYYTKYIKDLAFDFKRYALILKRTAPLYSKIKIHLKYNKPIKRNSNVVKLNKSSKLKLNDLYIPPYYVSQSPYITYEEMRRREEYESKKKWISKRGFITSVSRNENNEMYY